KRALASYFGYYHGPEPIWGSTSNVHSLGRSRVSARLSQSRSSAVFITVTNPWQRNDMAAAPILANDNLGIGGIFSMSAELIILPENETWRRTGMIRHISAVTFAVRDMARSIEFYGQLGFELLYGGERATFSSLKVGEAFINLSASPGYE